MPTPKKKDVIEWDILTPGKLVLRGLRDKNSVIYLLKEVFVDRDFALFL